MNKLDRFLDSLTARQYGEVVFPLFGTKSGMAQFLQIPANDKIVSVAGFVQSRSHEFGR